MDEKEVLEIVTKAAEQAAAATAEAMRKAFGQETQAAIDAATAEAARVGAEIGAQASAKAIEKDRKRRRDERTDRRLHNTKLLLRNYSSLAENCAKAVYDAGSEVTGEEGVEEIIEKLDEALDEGIEVQSIMKSAARTQLIIDHLNRMLSVYKAHCMSGNRPEEQRRYRVIEALFLSKPPLSPAAVAEREKIDKRTVYKDIDAACQTLSVLFFGIDGMNKA